MSHDIEGNYAFFASGTPAWHKLGTVLKDAPSVEEGWKLAYPFEVYKLLAAAKINGVYQDAIDEEGKELYSAIVRSDGKFLSFQQASYEVVQPFTAFKVFERLMEQKLVTLEAGGSLADGKRMWGLAKVNNSECDILPGDMVKAYYLFHTSFDGSLTTGFKNTGVRVVCANTLAMAIGSNGQNSDFTSRHTKGTHDRIEDYTQQIEATLKS